MSDETHEEPTLLGQIPVKPAEEFTRMMERRAEARHYAAMGRVAVAWSLLEAVVDTASIRLAGLDANKGVCFSAQIAGPTRKLETYRALARLQKAPPQLIKELGKFEKKARSLSERRNRYVHDVWFFDHPNLTQRFEATARGVLRLEKIPTSTEELMEFALEVEEATGDFEHLSDRIPLIHRHRSTSRVG